MAEKESSAEVAESCAGGAVTVSATVMVCALPAHGLGATQVTTIVA